MYGLVSVHPCSVESGIIHFGDTNQFLYSGQVPLEKGVKRIEIISKTIVEVLFSLSKQTINFCLEPKQAYDDPQGSFFPESSVEEKY